MKHNFTYILKNFKCLHISIHLQKLLFYQTKSSSILLITDSYTSYILIYQMAFWRLEANADQLCVHDRNYCKVHKVSITVVFM